jgi:hypothetical protein
VLDALSFPCPQATVQKVLLDTLKNENKLWVIDYLEFKQKDYLMGK